MRENSLMSLFVYLATVVVMISNYSNYWPFTTS